MHDRTVYLGLLDKINSNFIICSRLTILFDSFTVTVLQPQIRKSWDSMENANKKIK